MRRLLLAGLAVECVLVLEGLLLAGLAAGARTEAAPIGVVRAFDRAINRGEAGAALALLAPDAFLLVDGEGLDRAEAAAWLRDQVALRARLEGSGYGVDGPLVGWTARLWRDDLESAPRSLPMVAAVREGRIRKWFLGVRAQALAPPEPEAAFDTGELPLGLRAQAREADSQEILLARLIED